MTSPTLTKIAAACAVLMLLASCANTIRGMGRDTAGAVNATEDAGHKVKRAVVNCFGMPIGRRQPLQGPPVWHSS